MRLPLHTTMLSAQHSLHTVFLRCALALALLCGFASYSVLANSQEATFNEDISHYLDKTQVSSLLAGETDFTLLTKEHMTMQAKGIAILVPDWATPANNALGLNYLRTQLVHEGYTTLAFNVPDPNLTVTTEPAARPVIAPSLSYYGDEQANAYQMALIARFKAVYQAALNYPGYIVVVAQGASAALLSQYFAGENTEQIDGFVLVSSYLPDHALSEKSAQDLMQIAPPVLDIAFSEDSSRVAHYLPLRRALSKKEHKLDYRQRVIFGRAEPHTFERLKREILGYFASIGI